MDRKGRRRSSETSGGLDRRKVLKYAAVGGLLGPAVAEGLPQTSGAAPNRVVAENRRAGTTDWQLTFVRSEDYRSTRVEGYCGQTSVRAGETLDVYVSAAPAATVSLDIYRMGYYGGTGGRLMKRVGPLAVTPQEEPVIAAHRLRECRWRRTTAVPIPADWLSGVYLGKLSCTEHRYQSYVIFIVRDDRPADVLFQCSDTTWQAYNKWPDAYSLYDSDPPAQPHSARTWVSFDRPYGKYPQVVDQPLSQGSGEFLLWEFPLCYWLEQEGYDVTYWSNIDTHADPAGLRRVKVFLSVGHDEYWTVAMFNHVKQAVDEGLSAGFLSGNSVKWAIDLASATLLKPATIDERTGLTRGGQRVPTVPDPAGRPDRLFHRVGRFGGLSEAERARPNYAAPFDFEAPNEGTLMGARNPFPPNGSADWIASKADHWIFEGTGMRNGDRVPGLVGWEHHGEPADIPGLEVVAEGTTINSGDQESPYAATVYPGPKGNWVFNAATIFWSMGLSAPPGLMPPSSHYGRPHGPDKRVQRITANFLLRCCSEPLQRAEAGAVSGSGRNSIRRT